MPNSHERVDLVIRAGRVVCPASGMDAPGAVAVRAGRIVACGPAVSMPAKQELDFPDDLLLPGLVDLHAHPARGGSKYGIDPERHMLPRGTTTVLSQGDAGASGWLNYCRTVIEAARTRVRLAINLAASGESTSGGCFESTAEIDINACQEAIRAGGDRIWGIAVNISPFSCGQTDPRLVLSKAVEAAERAGRPLLFGPRRGASDFPLDEQLALLRPGDVLTYCFHADSENILDRGDLRACVWQARQRGILFDVGHGAGSFNFAVAEAAIAQGFRPDTISTDLYQRHVGVQPVHDLPRTISKLIAAGLSDADAWPRATVRPATLLGLAGEIGTLAAGSCADLAVLRWNPQAPALRDTSGAERPGGCWEPVLTVRAGELVWPVVVP